MKIRWVWFHWRDWLTWAIANLIAPDAEGLGQTPHDDRSDRMRAADLRRSALGKIVLQRSHAQLSSQGFLCGSRTAPAVANTRPIHRAKCGILALERSMESARF